MSLRVCQGPPFDEMIHYIKIFNQCQEEEKEEMPTLKQTPQPPLVYQLISSFRRCDSRNLDMSPLCKLSSGVQPAMWSDEVLQLYNLYKENEDIEDYPDYIKQYQDGGNKRRFYPTESEKDREIISTLARNSELENYDAFEKDMSMVEVYFGAQTTLGNIFFCKV